MKARQIVGEGLKARRGDKHLDTAMTQSYYGVALARAGRDSEALQELKAAMPILISISREDDDDSATSIVQRDQKARFIVEN
jgi:hypothetical protein